MYIHELKSGNRLHEIPLDIGSICQLSGDKRYSEFFYMFTSTIIPKISYRVDLTENPPKVEVI